MASAPQSEPNTRQDAAGKVVLPLVARQCLGALQYVMEMAINGSHIEVLMFYSKLQHALLMQLEQNAGVL